MTPRENNSDQETERYRIGLFRKFPQRGRLVSVELVDQVVVGESLLWNACNCVMYVSVSLENLLRAVELTGGLHTERDSRR